MAGMLKTGEDLMKYVCKKVAKDCKLELKTLGVDTKKLTKFHYILSLFIFIKYQMEILRAHV